MCAQCTHSVHTVSRYKAFLAQTVQIQPFIKVWAISAWDNLKSQHSLPLFPRWKNYIQGKIVLFVVKLCVQEPMCITE